MEWVQQHVIRADLVASSNHTNTQLRTTTLIAAMVRAKSQKKRSRDDGECAKPSKKSKNVRHIKTHSKYRLH